MEKSRRVPRDLYNPPLVIRRYELRGKIFSVFRDDLLPGGTKQRVFVELFEDSPYENFYYCGNSFGFAQLAGAYAAKLTGKTFTVYLQNDPSVVTREAANMTPNFNYVTFDKYKSISELHAIVDDLIKDDPKAYRVEYGGKELVDSLTRNIREALPEGFEEPKRLWLVAGSGTILEALYRVFPNTYFNAVQVGGKIYDDMIQKHRTSLFIAPQSFVQPVPKYLLPPYPSLATYDAKLWQFFIKHNQDGDYIWNVARRF